MYIEIDKTLTQEQEEIKIQSHKFAKEVLRPASIVLDKATPEEVIAPDSVLWDVFKAWFSLGNHTNPIPQEFGGLDLDPVATHVLFEELGWGAADLAVSLGVATFPFQFTAYIAKLTDNSELAEEIVKPFVEDTEAKHIGCWAITEPEHGSDTLGVHTEAYTNPKSASSTRAHRVGDDWVISGQKSAWVSNGTIATHALLFCNIDSSMGSAGGGVAIVPLQVPGVKKGKPLDKLGQRALNQGEIFFDDVKIPARYMLVGPDLYTWLIDATLATANMGMGVIFTGLARAAFEEALTYAQSRKQGAKTITEHQVIQEKLFSMFSAVETARMVSRAVLKYNMTTIPPLSYFSIASKILCTKTAFEVASDAIQVMGGVGLTKEMPAEKLLRDARSSMIEDGVNEFLALVGARQVIDSYKP
ncbi:MAG: acyl-CoA/acyl-ACP dehydrogenase [Actinobacteria bacterium]|nr:acyl-CoA/acyl-ACP dehydrogenase [Actinomycetota bacterium]MCL6105038.1 acyl-CoA/acyl-ACP dehydrogenase [Actinomycetota bacterium]